MERDCECEENNTIPFLKFGFELEEGSEEWKEMSKKVREACESHGFFLLVCDSIPEGLREDMIAGLKALFGLPRETKEKHTIATPYHNYAEYVPEIPLSQSFGIDDTHQWDSAHAFTNRMWPQGNPSFCETMKSTSSKLRELSFLILRMILEGYDLPKHYTSDIEHMKGTTHLRLMKYKAPEKNKAGEIGLIAHTDKSALAILCQDEVQGLEVQTKTGKWIQLEIPKDAYVVVVGDVLKAWSNGRLHAVNHRVMMSGDKERYSLGVFTAPKGEVKIEAPSELVDEKMHPLRYRPFCYGEYIKYVGSTSQGENALDAFAGV